MPLTTASAAVAAKYILLLLAASTTAYCQDQTDSDWYGKTALAGMVRCHKCLFSDQQIMSGDIAFLMRSADSHQRLLTPLELSTNAGNLPGRFAAELFYKQGDAALKHTELQLQQFLQQQSNSATPAPPAAAVQGRVAAAMEDLVRFHRLLQYSIAAGATEGWLRDDAWRYNVAMYEKVDADIDSILKGLTFLEHYYKTQAGPGVWDTSAAGAFEHLRSKLQAALEYKQAHAGKSAAATSRPFGVHAGTTGASAKYGACQILFEDSAPFIGSLSRTDALLIDPIAMQMNDIPAEERTGLAAVQRVWAASVSQ